MSTVDLVESDEELGDYDHAARLLSSICPDFVKDEQDLGLGSPESFGALFYRGHFLFDTVKKARSMGNFDEVWSDCILIARPRRPGPTCPQNVSLILNSMRTPFLALATGAAELPPYNVDHLATDIATQVKALDLHTTYEDDDDKTPVMLLHNLGGFGSDPVLNERVRTIFRRGQNTFLVNVSASGKTRLLYEGLCQHWGFYVTFHPDESEPRTLHESSYPHIMPGREPLFTVCLPEPTALGFHILLAKNREIVNRRFSVVLLVHLLVFREFIQAALETGTLHEEHKYRWFLAQWWYPFCHSSPRPVFIKDRYVELFSSIEFATLEYIDKSFAEVTKDILFLLPDFVKEEGLFFVIDEANVGVRAYHRAFHDETGFYPILKELIRLWRARLSSFGIPITLIVAGVEIPMQHFPRSSPEWSSWKWTSNTGAFDNQAIQKRYVTSFLPPSLVASPSGELLLQRIWNWCRTRHRLTAVAVSLLLQNGFIRPHRVLDAYIYRFTDYQTEEAKEVIAREEDGEINGLVYNSLSELIMDDILVRSTTHEVIFHYVVTGAHPRYFGISRVKLVSSGVGRFIDDSMESIAIDEPALLVAAAMRLARKNVLLAATRDSYWPRYIGLLTSLTEFTSYNQCRWENGETYRPASYVAFYLAHAFQNGVVLSEVFTLPTEPVWANNTPGQLTQIVILHKDDAGNLHETYLGPSFLLPDSAPLGYAAQTPTDVHSWLSHEQPAAFCLCPPECGADLIFVLKHECKYLWVVLSTAGRGTDTPVDINRLQSALKSMLPLNIFAEDMSDETVNSRIADAFSALPNGVPTGGQYSMLRVVATFPSQFPIRRSVAQRIKGPPVAVLDTTKFQAVTEDIENSDIVETLISSLQDRRQTHTDENSVIIELPLPSSPKQRDGDVSPPPPSKRTKTASGSRPKHSVTSSSAPAPQPTRILPKRSTRNPSHQGSGQRKEPLPPPAESSRKTKKNPPEKPLRRSRRISK